VAVSLRPSGEVSIKTLLRIGSVVRGLTARETTCRAWPNASGEQVSFMFYTTPLTRTLLMFKKSSRRRAVDMPDKPSL
jgi:hypothetical protein